MIKREVLNKRIKFITLLCMLALKTVLNHNLVIVKVILKIFGVFLHFTKKLTFDKD